MWGNQPPAPTELSWAGSPTNTSTVAVFAAQRASFSASRVETWVASSITTTVSGPQMSEGSSAVSRRVSQDRTTSEVTPRRAPSCSVWAPPLAQPTTVQPNSCQAA